MRLLIKCRKCSYVGCFALSVCSQLVGWTGSVPIYCDGLIDPYVDQAAAEAALAIGGWSALKAMPVGGP